MASKTNAAFSLFLCINLLLFTFSSACGYGCPKPYPKPSSEKCPVDTLKLGVCANLLKDLLKVKVGEPPVKPCCSLIEGLVDLEAAVCLCTTIKASALGINLDLPVSLRLLVNACGKKVPEGFTCA